MKRFAAILFMICGQALGQSGVYNVPYKPQPRILIPHVEAPAVLVDTNGTITANPYRNLKYCDFVIKAIDQSGAEFEGKVIRWVYSSSQILSHPGYDPGANVFFQRSDLSWPGKVLRQKYNFGAAPEWAGEVSATNYPSHVKVWNQNQYGYSSQILSFKELFNGMPRWRYDQEGALYQSEYLFTGVSWVISANMKNGNYSYGSTNFLEGNILAIDSTGGSIQLVSGNSACAIEVYPSIRASWMFQGNPNVKWMCLLSNGIDFYRDPQSGEPMWFNVEVEWVDRVPQEGVWSN